MISLMQSRFSLTATIIAATRLSAVSNKCCGVLGTMSERYLNPRGFANHGKNLAISDNEGGESQTNKSFVSYDEEYPSLSASIHSMPKSRRRNRIDLITHSQHKPEKVIENVVPIQYEEASLSIIHSKKIGKERVTIVSRSRFPQNLPEHGDELSFDICLPEDKPNGSNKSMNEKKSQNWVQKVQSAGENGLSKNTGVNVMEESGKLLRPGMVLFKNYIPIGEQVDIVTKCRELGLGPGGFYRPGYNDGSKLRLYMMCLGLDWNPQTKSYEAKRHVDNVTPPRIPSEFISLVCKVLDDSHTLIKRELNIINAENILPVMSPDVCIVNYYNTNGRLGLHQDRDESFESLSIGYPVVSVSIGDSAEFLYGDGRDFGKAERVLLESGDVLIFGGESRHIFHGVKNIVLNTAPRVLTENARFRPGRLNLTFRKY